MKKIIIAGDIHGDFQRLRYVCNKYDGNCEVIQLGDFGIGFGQNPKDLPLNCKFFPGNHDNYEECIEYPQYLGRFGEISLSEDRKTFFVSGARSIDQHHRTPMIDWWPWEELSDDEFAQCKELYTSIKPNIMFTHDAPHFIYYDLLVNKKKIRPESLGQTESRTNLFLEELFKIHQPKLWVFGHLHKSYSRIIDETLFRCLDCNETMEL